MKRIILVQRFFILILVVFCMAAFTYSPLSSNTKWLNSQTRTITQKTNNQLKNHADLVRYEAKEILKTRPDDREIIMSIDTILQNIELVKIKIDSLLKLHQISQINQLLTDLNQYNQSLLGRVDNRNPIIRDEEIETVLRESALLPISKNSDYDTIVNNLYYKNWSIVNFLYRRVGGTIIWCGFGHRPRIDIPWGIPQGETVQGKIHLPIYASESNKQRFYIQNQQRSMENGVAKLDTVFTTKGKHSIEVQVDYRTDKVVNLQIEKTFKSVRDTFDIYVFE